MEMKVRSIATMVAAVVVGASFAGCSAPTTHPAAEPPVAVSSRPTVTPTPADTPTLAPGDYVVNGFDAAQVYQACIDVFPPAVWGGGATPSTPEPLAPKSVQPKSAGPLLGSHDHGDPNAVVIEVHWPVGMDEVCAGSGNTASPTVEFVHIFDLN